MSEDNKADGDWHKLYHWFHDNTEVLQDQLDRLDSNLRSITPTVNACSEASVRVKQATLIISDEVRRAQIAWADGENLAKRIAQQAASAASASATKAVTDSVGTLEVARKSLAQTSTHFQNEAAKIQQRFYLHLVMGLFLIMVAAYGGYYVAKLRFETGPKLANQRAVEEREELIYYGRMFKKMYNNAPQDQKRMLKKLWDSEQAAELKKQGNGS
jgi:hypothetical protein